ncbi:MAG: DUF4249 domain-containing protein [Salinivirgaceae bacterium]|jgi:hypothetical protein|nr:DUF4249 domain-containing protein [Salinivirgaceae bacterium]
MRIFKFIFSAKLFIMVLLFISCEKVIDIELEESEQMIVVNSVINPDSLILVNLTRNRHILDNADIQPMEESKYHPIIKLFADDNYVENLVAVADGDYISSIKPEIGVNYSLQISEPKFNTVYTSCKIPAVVSIGNIDTSTVTITTDEYYYWSGNRNNLNCKVAINDPVGENNYYMIKIEADKSYWQIRDTSYMVVDSALVNGKWIYDFREITNYEKYDRFIDNQIYYTSDDISVQFKVGNSCVFSDAFFDGNAYEFSASIPENNLYSLDSTIIYINLVSLSEEYYKYLKTRHMHYSSKDDFFTTPVPVYNNIVGGAGIMGSFSKSKSSFSVKLKDSYEEYQY